MYKVESELLEEITKILDKLNVPYKKEIILSEFRKQRAKKLSEFIKNNYTEVKP